MELMTKQGYKQTEVGLIPEDWKEESIGTITTKIVGGGTPSRSNSSYWNGNIPWVTVKDFSKFNRLSSQENITKLGLIHSASNLIPKGTLITSTRMALGKAFIYDVDVSINQDLKALFLKNNCDVLLLYYWFQINSKRIEEIGSGSTVMGISLTDLRKFIIPLPPTLTEQKAIATALSDVDALIASLEQTITKKKAIKQGAMQALLNGKIRLHGFGEAKAMKDSELGLIPEDWDVKLLPEVFDYIHGKAHEQHIDSSGRFTVVNSKFISTEGKVTKNSKENFCPARKGDILTVLSDLPNGKALAKTYYVNANNKYAVNQRICIWRSKKDSPLYLSYIMNRHKYFMKFDDGVTQTHILNHHIEKCPVLVPGDIKEQKAIGEALNDMDAEITQLETKKAKYQAIKQGMMQELLTGKTRLV